MKLLAVDGNSIINRAYYGIRLLSTKSGIYTNGIVGFLNILMKVQGEVAPEAVAVAFDMRAPTFRHEMFDDYKAGRKGMPEELAMQMPLLQELLGYLGYTIVKKEGWEADDILGTLAETCRGTQNECVIATGDRDTFQLVGDNISVRLAYTQKGKPQVDLVNPAYILEKYGLEPQQLIDVKALMGDQSDNIPGVKGIGEKTALDLIQKHHTLDAIYENFDTIELKPGVRKNLEAGKEMAYMSRDLAEIDCAVPIETNLEHYLKRPVDNALAYPFMAKLEMFGLMEKLGVRPPSQMELAAVSAPVEKKPLEIEFGPIPAELLGQESLDILFHIDGAEVLSLCVVQNHKLYYQDQNAEQMAETILTHPIPKRTNHLKALWHWAMARGMELQNVTFDAEIAAYILNPNASDYQLERLYGEYGVFPLQLEESQAKAFPLLATAVGFTALCDTLWDEIENNGQQELLQGMELPLAEVLASMERIGIAVDQQGIREFGTKIQVTLDEVEQRIYQHAGETFNINSPKQLGTILFEKLGMSTKKKTQTGYSTNVDVLESLKGKHPIINDILEYRQLAKLKSTYVEGLLAVVNPEDGRIHTTFQQTLTRTGRISSTEPNLQNIPIRTPLGSEMRRFFVAQQGTTFVDSDYSQIELRVLAHLANDQHMIEAFIQNEDIHTQTASQVFDMPLEMVTPLMRSRAKAVNFGIVYGIGAFSLSQDIGVSVSEADLYIKEYLAFYSGVKKYMENIIQNATETGYVSTMFHRRRYLPELTSSNYRLREFGKRVARNTPIQGTAADIIKIAMIRVYQRLKKEGLKSRLVLQVHDELILESPPEELEQASKILQEEMEQAAPKMTVPLVAEVHTGANWLEV